MKPPKIALLANGPLDNRGNEAILLGTHAILKKHIPEAELSLYSVFNGSREQFEAVETRCRQLGIRHARARLPMKRFGWDWFVRNALRRISPSLEKRFLFHNLPEFLRPCDVALSCGGDLYTPSRKNTVLDIFYRMDDIALNAGLPYFYWGASVGPFTKMTEFEAYFKKHVENIGVFARETATFDYLKGLGKDHGLFLISDPAFAMRPERPDDLAAIGGDIPPDSIGLNINAFLLNFVKDATYPAGAWTEDCLRALRALLKKTQGKIFLIYHVTMPGGAQGGCDRDFMRMLRDRLDEAEKKRTVLLPPGYTAPQLKWVISQMRLLVAARTHATIAAFSTHTPVVSISYSQKSKGLNRDLFETLDYCVDAEKIATEPDALTDAVERALANEDAMRRTLAEKIPAHVANAYKAGEILREILGKRGVL